MGDLRGLRGLKGRPRCLTSLLDPVKKTHFDEGFEGFAGFDGQALMSHVAFGSCKKHFGAASSKPLLASFEGFEGFEGLEGFEGQAPMSNVAFGSRKKTKTHFDERFEGLAGFDGQAVMSHVAFGSCKKTFWSSLEQAPSGKFRGV